jgi:hypothetical protein
VRGQASQRKRRLCDEAKNSHLRVFLLPDSDYIFTGVEAMAAKERWVRLVTWDRKMVMAPFWSKNGRDPASLQPSHAEAYSLEMVTLFPSSLVKVMLNFSL